MVESVMNIYTGNKDRDIIVEGLNAKLDLWILLWALCWQITWKTLPWLDGAIDGTGTP